MNKFCSLFAILLVFVVCQQILFSFCNFACICCLLEAVLKIFPDVGGSRRCLVFGCRVVSGFIYVILIPDSFVL